MDSDTNCMCKIKTILFDYNFDTKCKKFVASYPVVTSGTCISVSGNEKGRGGWRLEAGGWLGCIVVSPPWSVTGNFKLKS